MKGSPQLALIIALVAGGGCLSDSVDPGPGSGSGSGSGSDPTGQVLGKLCGATFTTQGSFAQSDAPPGTFEGGCWPIGTWTFTVTMGANDCSPAPTLLAQYQFKVAQVPDENNDPVWNYTYLTNPSAKYHLKVTQGGSGECAGALEVFSDDGKQDWNLHPELNADGSITGDGEYGLYDTSQWD